MEQHLQIFKSLFKGREDVFAIRWERNGKSGYMPAYNLNWDAFKIHKAKGGTFKDFNDKEYAPLTDERMLNHLAGREILGIYPLLQNNTSWFIAADFDQSASGTKVWIDECRAFMLECEKYNLPVYLERSRSGTGGHVWMFFDKPYPAYKSRRLFTYLLTASGVTKALNNHSNFDRLFPNQDTHSGQGLGNLIALPLQKKAMENENTCFILPENLTPVPDQWLFLTSIERVKNQALDDLYETIFSNKKNNPENIPGMQDISDGAYPIILSNEIVLQRNGLDPLLAKYVKDHLRVLNKGYFIKKAGGRSTYGSDMYLETVEENEDSIIIPRGIIGKLLHYCQDQKIPYQLVDRRIKLEPVIFNSSISLLNYQQEAVEVTNKKDFGVFVAPPGSGKTIMGLEIVKRKQQPTLIIVHRRQLFDQWVNQIQSFLGIPKFRIGRIEGGNYAIGEEITVAMIQSLQTSNTPDKEKLYQSFGTIIVDECHHIPAKTFREVIRHFNSYYCYGFTATPVRKNGDEELIFIYLGRIIHEAVIPVTSDQNKQLSVIIQNTELYTPFNASTDKTETLINILIHDTARNEMIVDDIKREVRAGRKILVLTERKSHVDLLHQYLKGTCETIILTGEDGEQNKKDKLQLIMSGDFQVLIATGQFIGEGTDIGILNCLFLVYPFSFEGKLVQYIGRVQRSQVSPVIYDYRDLRIEYFNTLFKQRNKYYRKLMKSGQLKSFDEIILIFQGVFFYINTTENLLPIDCLNLPLPVEAFKEGVNWKLRVNNYNEAEGELFAEIIDYSFPDNMVTDTKYDSFYFYGIEKISFRSLDTTGFLKSVVLKQHPEMAMNIPDVNPPVVSEKKKVFEEKVILKTMKVPFGKINFLYGSISFPLFIDAVKKEIVFEIANPDIRPEFAAIRDYFSKALKKNMITVNITVRYKENQILSATAQSEDIDTINHHMIDSVRFEFVQREVLKGKLPPLNDKAVHTIDDLLQSNQSAKKLFSSESKFIDDILNIKESKHYLQLKYLSSKHEASVLKVRFVLQPFSFLFLLAGDKKYYIVWETLDSEEATYVWHTDKTRQSLRIILNEIEVLLKEIKQSGRQAFLQKEHDNFNRVVHNYADAAKGFIEWKAALEEKLL